MPVKLLRTGVVLLKIFLASIFLDIVILILCIPKHGGDPAFWAPRVMLLGTVECLVFWAGIILIYISSSQLGIKMRILGILCGWIPIVNLMVLTKMISICSRELRFEKNRSETDRERIGMQICRTKYPILLVHGVFFRDFKHFNYWGRFRKRLRRTVRRYFTGSITVRTP